MRQFGLIGYPLGHSFSQKFFSEKFEREGLGECRYDNFPLQDITLVESVIEQNPHLEGFNVTIPYKEVIIQYLDKIDEVAAKVQAVNTVKVIRKDGKTMLQGFNTDVTGFSGSLKPLLRPEFKKALVLGNGGAAKAVKYALSLSGLEVLTVSRRAGKEGNIIPWEGLSKSLIEDHLLIINTTPLGTFPEVEECPDIPYEGITEKHLLYDLVYNPAETMFLKKGRMKKAKTMNGLAMLELQALAAWEIWNDENNGLKGN